ncbi:hypothetical protein GTU79_06525 [Sodalis ligni]|uniref:hypothetical protein n=1 Tax=Sodalis ligni TaxID=2697027 RepID=UPI001BDEF6CC|nr:hypothetical protein [Sodalis ligni]QWA12393.1 hypothetical protein GTU79_06525 [Sodalis ligni]
MRKKNSVAPSLLHLFPFNINKKIFYQIKNINKFNIITATIAMSLCIYAIPEKASAACAPAPANGVTTTCDTSSVQTTTLGTGPGLDNVAIDVLPSAQIDTGEISAISLDSGSAITLQENAVVQNASHAPADSGFWGNGENAIEFNNDTTLTVERGAQVQALGTAYPFANGAVHIIGAGNTITNHGLIFSTGGPAIRFETNVGGNTLDNYGTIAMSDANKIVIDSEYTNGVVSIINRTGGRIFGGILFGTGNYNITLEHGSVY